VGPLPLWLDEGLAEYYEVSPSARRINHEHLPTLAGLRQGDYLRLSLERLAAIDLPEQMTSQQYSEAWLWAHFLMEGGHREIVMGYLRARKEGLPVVPAHRRIQDELPQAEQLVLAHLDRLTAGP
jgi:hypothetical protein